MADNFEKLIEDLREEIKNGKIGEIKYAQSFIRDLFSCFGYEKYCFSKDLDFEVHTHAQDRADAIIGDEILIEMKSSNKSIDSEEVKSQVFNYNRFLGKPIVITCNFVCMNIYSVGEENPILTFNFLDYSKNDKKKLFEILHRDSLFQKDYYNYKSKGYQKPEFLKGEELKNFELYYKKYLLYINEFIQYSKNFVTELQKNNKVKLEIYENDIFTEGSIYLYEILSDRLILLLHNIKSMINRYKYIKVIEELIFNIKAFITKIRNSNIYDYMYKVNRFSSNQGYEYFINEYNKETDKIFNRLIEFNSWLIF